MENLKDQLGTIALWGFLAAMLVGFTWCVGAIAIFVGIGLNAVLEPLGVPDFNIGTVNETYAPFLIGLPFVALFFLLVDLVEKGRENTPPETPDPDIPPDLIEAAIRQREAETKAWHRENSFQLDTQTDIRTAREEDKFDPEEIAQFHALQAENAKYEDPNSPYRVQQRQKYYLQVWEKIWDEFNTNPFTTDDVQNLGNTLQEADEVITFIKDWGELRTVALYTFEINRGPPDIQSNLDESSFAGNVAGRVATKTTDRSTHDLLLDAVAAGDEATVSKLIEDGVEPNAMTKSGFSALHAASGIGQVGIAALLIEAGSDVNLISEQRPSGSTPLGMAVVSGDSKIVELLIKHGANVNKQTLDGTCALHTAVEQRHFDIVETLLSNGADPNMREHRGLVPLHFVAANSEARVDIAEILLSNGADPDIRNRDGFTPCFYAQANGHKQLADVLKSTE